MGFLERDFVPKAIEDMKKTIKDPKTPNPLKFKLELLLLCNKYYKEMPMESFYGILAGNLMGLHYQEMELSKEEISNMAMRDRLGIEDSDANKP